MVRQQGLIFRNIPKLLLSLLLIVPQIGSAQQRATKLPEKKSKEDIKKEIDKLGLGLEVVTTGNAISIATVNSSSAVLSDLVFDPIDNLDASLFKIEVGEKEFLQANQNMSQSLKDFNEAISHVSVKHATLGAKIQAVTTQTEILQQFKITVSEDVSELRDADLAEVVTELKQLLLNKDAAQQVYAKLNQQTLFDFIR